MRPIAKQILTWLVIAFFIRGLYAGPKQIFAKPAKCESDKDCLKGKALCIHKECHCNNAYAYGDGKTKCEQWEVCPDLWNNLWCKRGQDNNSHCLKVPGLPEDDRVTSCRCDDGYYGIPKRTSRRDPPSCKKVKERTIRPCDSKSQCASWAECVDKRCQCVGSYVGDGGRHCRKGKSCPSNNKCGSNAICLVDPLFPRRQVCKCKRLRKDKRGKCVAPVRKCKYDQHCDKRAKCDEGRCICQGKMIGNGKYCRDSLSCPKDADCGVGGTCLVDPYMPDTIHCRCDKGYFKARDGKCVECFSKKDCNAVYSACINRICECKDELVHVAVRTCKGAPAHPCSKDGDCHKNAVCHRGKCHCIGKTTGNGKICRASLPCPKELRCDDTSVCIVDPLFPNEPECKCHLDFKKSAGGKRVCEEMTECEKNGVVCSANEACRKVKGGFSCGCKKGYEMVDAGGKNSCQDVDECMKADACPANSVCKNTEGSYECRCNGGYKKNAHGACDEICDCGAHATCHSEICICDEGFIENKQEKCADVDECAATNPPCAGAGEMCENKLGTYSCTCRGGYEKMNGGCVKKDGCNCKENEECYEGVCYCERGYRRNDKGLCAYSPYLGGGLDLLHGSGHSLHVSGHHMALILGLLGYLAFMI